MACRVHGNAHMADQKTEQDSEADMAIDGAHDSLDTRRRICSGAASIARSMSEFVSSRY
jgi:hypothetical protein